MWPRLVRDHEGIVNPGTRINPHHFRARGSAFLVLMLAFVLVLSIWRWFLPHMGYPLSVTPEPQLSNPQVTCNAFAAIGDNGSGYPAQYRLADEMAREYQRQPYCLVMMLGDSIYPDGNVKKYGEQRFTKPYRYLLDRHVAFWPVLGNHDVLGGYADDVMAFFKMPGTYYQARVGLAHIIALDTNRFDATQRQWLEKTLKGSTSPWKIVYGHHPVVASGFHHVPRHMVTEIKPLLEQYNVDLYLCGHNHHYERSRSVNGVTYVVSGGGGARTHFFRRTHPDSLVRIRSHEFLRIDVDPQTLTLKAINPQGEVIDRLTLEKPQTSDFNPLTSQ